MKCIYCESPEIRERTVFENAEARAFLTNIPIVPGHTLIISKRCVPKYENLTDEEKRAIEDARLKICTALTAAFGAKGFNFAWNDGTEAGQSIPHFHLHVVPRKKGGAGIYEYEPRKFLYRPGERETSPEEELRAIAELIKKSL